MSDWQMTWLDEERFGVIRVADLLGRSPDGPPQGVANRISEEQIRTAFSLRAKRKTNRHIAAEVGICATTVHRLFAGKIPHALPLMGELMADHIRTKRRDEDGGITIRALKPGGNEKRGNHYDPFDR